MTAPRKQQPTAEKKKEALSCRGRKNRYRIQGFAENETQQTAQPIRSESKLSKNPRV
jgi:hypothetical protein